MTSGSHGSDTDTAPGLRAYGPGAASPDGRGTEDLSPDSMIRIVLRPVASGLPLGFLAFGAGTILLTALG